MLYQDWVPFLIAIGFVVVHHGPMGAVAPDSVYAHCDADVAPVAVGPRPRRVRARRGHSEPGRLRLNEQLLRDPLTELPNRLLLQTVSGTRSSARGGTGPSSLSLHRSRPLQGDQRRARSRDGRRVLRVVGASGAARARATATSPRFGGDEFVVV